MCILFQDPGNLEADLQAGGFAGYDLLWLFLVCTIMVSASVESLKYPSKFQELPFNKHKHSV